MAMNSYKKWTVFGTKKLCDLIDQGESRRAIAGRFGRTPKAVSRKLEKIRAKALQTVTHLPTNNAASLFLSISTRIW